MNRINLQSSSPDDGSAWVGSDGKAKGQSPHRMECASFLPPHQTSSNYGNYCNLIISTLRRVPVIRSELVGQATRMQQRSMTRVEWPKKQRHSRWRPENLYLKAFQLGWSWMVGVRQDQGKVNSSGCWHGIVIIAWSFLDWKHSERRILHYFNNWGMHFLFVMASHAGAFCNHHTINLGIWGGQENGIHREQNKE